MAQRAILVGVQDYSGNPLTAPAKDVRDVYDALVSNQIFAPHEITTLIDDGSAADGPASREEILGALEPLYYDEPCDRLLVYFSGHGASWRVSGGASILKPVLLCHGVQNFGRDGGKMIDVEELLERFHMRGPTEQIWMIDACRNLPDQPVRPVVAPTSWGDMPAIAVRRRALLYAVAPLAQAAAIKGGNSVFTREVLEGLEGRGRAAVYDPEQGSWVVTHRSICDYARARLEGGMAEWEREFKLPRIEFESNPAPGPIRALPDQDAPRPRGVSLNVTPTAASAAISARLEREGVIAAEWPPHLQSIRVAPAVFRFEATLSETGDWESVNPPKAVIDTREVVQINITVNSRPRPPLFESLTEKNLLPDTEPEPTSGLVETLRRGNETKDSRIEIESDDRSVTFSATRHGTSLPPMPLRRTHEDDWQWPKLEPGLWNIVADLAGEKLGSIDIDLPAATVILLRLVASMPTALRNERWSTDATVATSVETPSLKLSETMGWIQGAVLPSLLPLVALKAFDNSVLEKLRAPWLQSSPIEWGQTPISVALAFDGDWEGRRRPKIDKASLSIGGRRTKEHYVADGGDLAVFAIRDIAPPPLEDFAEIPDRNLVILKVPGWGRLEFAVPLVPNRVASVGIVVRAAGRFELSIASLSPGFDPEARHGRSATSRAVAIGARLLGAGSSANTDLINDAAYGKWVDPVLGALSWHAIENREDEFWNGSRGTIARNMYAAFPSLPDSVLFLYWLMVNPQPSVTFMHEFPDLRFWLGERLLIPVPVPFLEGLLGEVHRRVFEDLPTEVKEPARAWRPLWLSSVFLDQPVLAASVDKLADAAQQIGNMDHWAFRRRALIPPGLVWNAAYFHETNDRQHD